MGKMNISLDDDLEKEFRAFVIETLGTKKGAISITLELAIKDYMKKMK